MTEQVNTKQSDGKVYDFTKKENVQTKCIYINAKALEGDYGVYGNINPQKIEGAPDTQGLF